MVNSFSRFPLLSRKANSTPLSTIHTMSDQQSPRPDLGRFGRCEPFCHFDKLSDVVSVGTEVVGKMMVDCKFLFKRSHWGVMGESWTPAGIIYMDLTFGPPQGCRVKSATVTVTLDEYDKHLNTYTTQKSITEHGSDDPVNLMAWYGPSCRIMGPENSAEIKQTKTLSP